MNAVAIDTVWVIFAGCLVLLMQSGFAALEMGLSRMKNAGAVAAKIIVNFALAIVVFWAIGYAIAFGDGSGFAGATAWFIDIGNSNGVLALQYSGIDEATKFFFEAMFAAVALAIVWGTMLDRARFVAYLPFAILFVGLIYPIVTHWVWGGGWLFQNGFQDFAGSGVVHITGAFAGIAGAIVVGPRLGKFRADGKPNPIPGHSMPLAVLGVLILWVGWMGFNAGSFLGAVGKPLGTVIVVTNLAGAFGVLGAVVVSRLLLGTYDIGMMGNGAIAGLGAIAGPCAFVDPWAGALIGLVAGCVMVPMVLLVDRMRIDDPIGVLAGHGMGGIVGVLAAGFLATPEAASSLGGRPGLFYGGGATQLGWQALGMVCIAGFAFVTGYVAFWLIKMTIGLRATESDEMAGLDISEHGMFGYPERFIEVIGAEPEDAHSHVGATLGHAARD
jgi:Amt family ammonium transporter